MNATLCTREGFITGCPEGTLATHTLRAVEDTAPHPLCDACTLDIAGALGAVVVQTLVDVAA